MPRGDKSSYSSKQKRQAEHIEDSYRKRGVKQDEAEERAWRTVNKQTGGARGKRSGSRSRTTTRRKPRSRSGSRRRTTARRATGRRSTSRRTTSRSRR